MGILDRTRCTAIAGALLAANAGAAAAGMDERDPQRCRATFVDRLEQLGVAQEVDEMTLVPQVRIQGEAGRKLLGYEAWVRLESCRGGHLVIRTNRLCDLRGNYTQGGCQVDGVPDY